MKISQQREEVAAVGRYAPRQGMTMAGAVDLYVLAQGLLEQLFPSKLHLLRSFNGGAGIAHYLDSQLPGALADWDWT